jgi:multisubunit Na+/H+ antiporter MnhG subunit
MQSAVGLEPSEISATISLPVINRVLHGDSVCDTYHVDLENPTICNSGECEELKYSLLQSLDSTTYMILCICGMVWEENENNALCGILRNGWNYIVLMLVTAPTIFILESFFSRAHYFSVRQTFYECVILFASCFQAIAIDLSNYRN